MDSYLPDCSSAGCPFFATWLVHSRAEPGFPKLACELHARMLADGLQYDGIPCYSERLEPPLEHAPDTVGVV